MGNSYIYNKVEKLVKKFKTRDPFEILEEMNVIVGETDRYEKLKGYCFMSCQTIYVMEAVFSLRKRKRLLPPTNSVTSFCIVLSSKWRR